MNLIWQRFTLSTLPLKAYLSSSFLHHITVGLLGSWRKGSILMQWGDTIGAILLCLVYLLAPFVPTSLVGVLLAACFYFGYC